MTSRRSALAALALALPCAAGALDSASGAELALFDLDAQLQAETTVASAARARSVRETPGVVTLIGREELRASGAADLQDLLLTVPGFQLAVDVWGVVDAGFRGIWGHEGKVLLLVDGHEMNDLFYGTNALGNHIPLELVDSVEIVRGPGSAVYGGFAELAVVRVTTRAAAGLSGGVAAAGWDGDGRGTLRAVGTVGAGGEIGGARLGVVGALGQGMRSGRPYTDLAGATTALGRDAALDPGLVAAHAAWRGLTLSVLHDDYRTRTADGNGAVQPAADVRYRTTAAEVRWALAPLDGVTVTPSLSWTRQTPWECQDRSNALMFYDKTADRWEGRLGTSTDVAPGVNVVAGTQLQLDRARLNQPGVSGQAPFATGDGVQYTNAAAFGELGWDSPFGNLVVGGRYERHSAFGSSFVPRVAYTNVLAPWHLKLLYSGAFRAPAIENLVSNPDVRPERVRVLEAETGVQMGEVAYLSANVFDIRVDGPIVYSTDVSQANGDSYRNFDRTGSRGVEAELRVGGGRASATLGWSYYDARGLSDVSLYAVPGRDDVLLGFAAHKLSLTGRWTPLQGLTVSPSALFLSERHAVVATAADGSSTFGTLPAAVYLNLFATWRGVLRGLEIGAGVRDLLGTGTTFPQPYASEHAPLPGAGRAFLVRLSWEQAG